MQILTECNLAYLVSEFLNGKTVVFPTETSYGLGCDATNQDAVDKIFQIKGRRSDKPLLVVVPNIEMAKEYIEWNDKLDELAKKHWPGPLTIVGKSLSLRAKRSNPKLIPNKRGIATPPAGARDDRFASGVVAKDGTVAVRVTSHPLLKSIAEKIGRPIVATSANISDAGSIYKINDILKTFEGREFEPDLVLNDGDLPRQKPSTLVSVVNNKVKILRQGEVVVAPFHKHHHWFYWLVFLVWILAAVFIVIFAWAQTMIAEENSSEVPVVSRPSLGSQLITPAGMPRVKAPEQVVKGIYLTAYSAGSTKKLDEIIKLIDSTELNAVVIDIKDYSGLVLYDSKIPLVNKLKTKDPRFNPIEVINKLHSHGIYVIARQTVMQDPVLAKAEPNWSIEAKTGGIWRDNKGLSWVDPTRKEVWDYNLAIAKEAISLGFDEINFDYVRFPSDGNISNMAFDMKGETKYEVMGDFYKFMSDGLKDQPAWLSLDMFGLTMEATGTFDMNIGQRIADATDYSDYICPMMYPSHYSSGHLGLANPADHPAEVLDYGLKMGLPKFQGTRAKVRPWIQAFDLGAIYDGAKIRAQINEVEKYTDAGWMMWNASNRYTSAGLKSK